MQPSTEHGGVVLGPGVRGVSLSSEGSQEGVTQRKKACVGRSRKTRDGRGVLDIATTRLHSYLHRHHCPLGENMRSV